MKYLVAYVLFISVTKLRAEENLLPNFIQPCDLTDPEFNKCVIKQMTDGLRPFSKGISELGVNSTDPVFLDDIHIDGSGLDLKFTNAQMHGLSNSKITHFTFNFGKGKDENIALGLIANLSLTAQYKVDGKVLILPIKGEGDALVECYGIEVDINSNLNRIKENKHLKLVTPNYKYNIASTTFDFKNLFNGNKQLGDTTLKFLNENWKELMDDLAPPVIKQIVATIIKNINKFLAKVPMTQMFKGYEEYI